MKVTSVFIKYLNYACKITWIEFLITLCLVEYSIKISKRKHSVTSRFIWEAIYKQLELMSHRDIPTLENNVWKHSRFALVFSCIVFSCLDIPVKHSLSLFIYYIMVGYFKNYPKLSTVALYYAMLSSPSRRREAPCEGTNLHPGKGTH
jgi:hypothetical protein